MWRSRCRQCRPRPSPAKPATLLAVPLVALHAALAPDLERRAVAFLLRCQRPPSASRPMRAASWPKAPVITPRMCVVSVCLWVASRCLARWMWLIYVYRLPMVAEVCFARECARAAPVRFFIVGALWIVPYIVCQRAPGRRRRPPMSACERATDARTKRNIQIPARVPRPYPNVWATTIAAARSSVVCFDTLGVPRRACRHAFCQHCPW